MTRARAPPTRTAANLGEFKLLNVDGRAQAVIEFEIKHARQEATPIELLVNHQPIATVSAADWTTVRLSAPVLKSVANALFGIVLLPLMQPNEDEDTVAVLVFFGSLPQIPLVLPA